MHRRKLPSCRIQRLTLIYELSHTPVFSLWQDQERKRPPGAGASGKDFDRPGLKWQFLDGDHTDRLDFYGDGSLIVLFTPGHSPGHQSFLVNLATAGPFLLTVDAAYTLDHWNEKALPGFLSSAVDTVRSVQKLHAIANQTGAQVVTGRDRDAWPKFKTAPQWYE